jgi:hypothetical protein
MEIKEKGLYTVFYDDSQEQFDQLIEAMYFIAAKLKETPSIRIKKNMDIFAIKEKEKRMKW